jgi:hypothetical protein
MKDLIYLTINKEKVVKMTKTLPDVRRGEIIAKVDVKVEDKCFGTATIPQEIFINDWRDGIDMEDVEFKKNIISQEEADIIKQRRLEKMTQILREQGFNVEKETQEE